MYPGIFERIPRGIEYAITLNCKSEIHVEESEESNM